MIVIPREVMMTEVIVIASQNQTYCGGCCCGCCCCRCGCRWLWWDDGSDDGRIDGGGSVVVVVVVVAAVAVLALSGNHADDCCDRVDGYSNFGCLHCGCLYCGCCDCDLGYVVGGYYNYDYV